MLDRIVILFIIIFICFDNTFAEEKGYFDIQNGSEYLGFSNMNKEFKITSLMNSAIANDAKAAKIFIASGADVRQKNIAGATALHLAARNNSFETAQVLIENGARVNERDFEGWTPLMRASLAGNQKVMKLLIEHGAEIWSQNNYGETPLMHTAMADCYECGKLILENTDRQRSDSSLINNQIKQSLQIVNKRYNEPFIVLLNNNIGNNSLRLLTIGDSTYDNINKTINKSNTIDEMDAGNITQLVYIFTGKTISKEKMQEIGKSAYNTSMKEQKKNKNKKEISNKPIILDLDSEGSSEPAKPKADANTIREEDKKSKQEPRTENTEKEEPKNNSRYKLVPTLSKPVIEEEKIVEKKENTRINKIEKAKETNKIIEVVEDKKEIKPAFTFKGEEKSIDEIKLEKESIKQNETPVKNKIEKNVIVEENESTGKYRLDPTLSKPVIEEDIKPKSEIVDSKKNIKFKLKNNENTLNNREVEIQETNNKNKYKFNLNSQKVIEKPMEGSKNIKLSNDKNKKVYRIKSADKQSFSFNSSMEDKKKSMKLINNNDKLNPGYVEYSLQSDEKLLNK